MRVLIFCLVSFCAGAQIKGIEDADTIQAYESYICGCFGTVYFDFDDSYYQILVFDADYSKIGVNQFDIVTNKLTEVLSANGLDIKSPNESDASSSYPNISSIRSRYKSGGYVAEENFRYAINDHIISFTYSNTEISLYIFKKAL